MRGQPRVLFIDDQPDRSARLHADLAAHGWTALFAQTGEDALWGLEHDAPECVVIDLSGPVLDGWFVLARLGARHPRPCLVAYSPDPADARRARDLGADVFVGERAGIAPLIVQGGLPAVA